jgi:zinc transporter ZupT
MNEPKRDALDTTNGSTQSKGRKAVVRTAVLFLIPLALLGLVIWLFVATSGAGLNIEPVAPIESLDFERVVLKPGLVELLVRNMSPQPIEIAQAAVKDMIVPFAMEGGRVLPRLALARIEIPYPWVRAEAYEIRLFSSNSVVFATAIEAAAETRTADGASLLAFTLIGLYVGVIPVFLGIFWFPALRRLGPRAFLWLMALTLGLLLFLGLDAINESLELGREIGGTFQGVGLAGLGIVGSFLLLDALAKRQAGLARGEDGQKRRVAAMISLGIGLHNLGEGLAIGSAFSVGAAALGTFFVIGFILQNITEGLGIIAPIVRQKPDIRFLAGLGVLGGAPAILGAWVGGFANSPALSVLFLSVGAGAVLEVAWEISRIIRKGVEKQAMPLGVWSGVLSGMLVLYVTGLLVK